MTIFNIMNEFKPQMNYLYFTANTAGSTVQLVKIGTPTDRTFEISTDGNIWSTYTFGDIITLTNIGDKVYWRNALIQNQYLNTSLSSYYNFAMTGDISVSGDITSLLNKMCKVTSFYDYTFAFLFRDCSSLTDASSLLLPNQVGGSYYRYMFQRCTSLTNAPVLPATTLSDACYGGMFYGCTSLVNAPALPATTLASSCYSQMFVDCSSLTSVPMLQATSVPSSCYYQMFYGCENIETLTELPATYLNQRCYEGMFGNCSRLKLSDTQTSEYVNEYRIPITGTGSVGNNSLKDMFVGTGGTFTGTPTINTTYYTSNTIV